MQTKFINKQEKRAAKMEITAFCLNGGELFSFSDQGVTVAIMRPFPKAKCVNVAISVKSASEEKFRLTMGKNIAIEKLKAGKCLTFPANADFDFIAGFVLDLIVCSNYE